MKLRDIEVEIIKKFISSVTATTIGNEVSGAVKKLLKQEQHSYSRTFRWCRFSSKLSFTRQQLLKDTNKRRSRTRRKMDKGKVIQISDHLEEHLILEDGSRIF